MTFDTGFNRDPIPARIPQDVSMLAEVKGSAEGLASFLSLHAGASYECGLYRIHAVADMRRWTTIVAEAFPDFSGRVFCFAYDWLGRQFALDFSRTNGSQCLVLMLEPGTGQALEIPCTFIDFHENELSRFRDEALASKSYELWRAESGQCLSFGECVGYRKPLFLGGSDTFDNLEITDLEVYWTLTSQLLAGIRGLPEGTHIRSIRID